VTAPEFREILDDYLSSCRELLDKAEETLLGAESAGVALTPEDLAVLKRVFHTLKGNSAMMGFDSVASAAHVMEDALGASGAGDAAADEEVISLLLAAIGMLSAAFRAGDVPETTPAAWREALADLARFAAGAGPAHAPTGHREDRSGPAGAPAPGEAAGHAVGGRSRSLRVSHASLERLLELSGELHVLLAGVSERVRRLGARFPSEEAEAAAESVELFSRTFGLLEREVFATRLVPVGTVLARFHRLVRDLGRDLGKEVDFVLQGGETTFDKSVVDELGEPLLHLVRNALDHGLERPEEREAKGKPRRGTLTLAARQASSLAEVAVLDDGAGIDPERVRRRAAELGIRTEEMDDAAVLELVFLPAFSTRRGVSALSGRGVGLDVVKASVERLGGAVRVRSVPGRGTEFRLACPLTLALTNALLVSVDGETYALPVSFLEETVRLEEGDVHSVASHGVLTFRDRLVPAVDAGAFLGSARPGNGRRRFASILSGGGRQKALLVDCPLETLQIVVKPLDESLGRPLGISGATLLGDGRVVMILDAVGLLDAHLEALRAAAGREV
jgi:two-component system chemotaxis sensor kinase CheA